LDAAVLQDGKTFVHVAAWESKQSSVHSVTLISGSCLAADASSYTDFAGALATAEQDGCNVQSVDNTTLIPTLVESGGIPTPQPLLVFITANVSLGFGLKAGSIPIHRPVVLVGLYSVPTSIDMYMVVNQLNVTSECCAGRRHGCGCLGRQLTGVCNNSSSGWLVAPAVLSHLSNGQVGWRMCRAVVDITCASALLA
jgi:hypothetical protein